MGMLINGNWSNEDQLYKSGEYIRQPSRYNEDISEEVVSAIVNQPKRFHLIASWSCPWSHRTMLIRQLKGLDKYIPLHIAGGKRVQGYPINNGKTWTIPGCNKTIVHLHELYTFNDANFTGRSTVPVLWDSESLQVISNESSKIMRAFDKVKFHLEIPTFQLAPNKLLADIESLNAWIYQNLANGVYRAGRAKTQQAYEHAEQHVFDTLDALEHTLKQNRFLLGNTITESDWCLFPTLVRFDIEYSLHNRCSRRSLKDYPNLWAYARGLYSFQGVAQTINFDAIHLSNYPDAEVIPVKRNSNWEEPHNRRDLGEAVCLSEKGDRYVISELTSLSCV